jgi:hypothetical protein
MSSRRLKLVKVCATCAQQFRACHKAQLTCSYTCAAIRRQKMYPSAYRMIEANQANRARFLERLEQQLAGKTPLECYELGRWRGYHSALQRERRLIRQAS